MPENTHNGGTHPTSVETGFPVDSQRLPTSTPEKTTPPNDVSKSNGDTELHAPNLQHGGRTKRNGIVLAMLGKRYVGIYQDLKHFRRVLEGYVKEQKGVVSFVDGLVINLACRWELVSRISQKMIASDDGKLPPEKIMLCLGRVADSTRNRNAAVAKLGISGAGAVAGDVDPWDEFEAARARGGTSDPRDGSDGDK